MTILCGAQPQNFGEKMVPKHSNMTIAIILSSNERDEMSPDLLLLRIIVI
jgi:hypothetical protein